MKQKIPSHYYRWEPEWIIPEEYAAATVNRFLYFNYVSRYTVEHEFGDKVQNVLGLEDPDISDPFSNVDGIEIINLHEKKLRYCPECSRYGFFSPHYQLRWSNNCFICGRELLTSDLDVMQMSLVTFPYNYSNKDHTETFGILPPHMIINMLPVFKHMVMESIPKYPEGFFEFYSYGSLNGKEYDLARRLIDQKPFEIIMENDIEPEYKKMMDDFVAGCVKYRKALTILDRHSKTYDSEEAYRDELLRRVESYSDGFPEIVREHLCRQLFSDYAPEKVLLAFEIGQSVDAELALRISYTEKYLTRSCPKKRYAVSDEIMMKSLRKPLLYGNHAFSSLGSTHFFNLIGSETEDEYEHKKQLSRLAHYLFFQKVFFDNFEEYCRISESARKEFKLAPAVCCIELAAMGKYRLKRDLSEYR